MGGDTGDQFGSSAAFVGDFNGDTFDDVIVGARLDDDGGSDSGTAFIFFGSATPLATIDAAAADVVLVGQNADDHFGDSVATAGDFNGDTFGDVIVGAPLQDSAGPSSGAAFLFLDRLLLRRLWLLPQPTSRSWATRRRISLAKRSEVEGTSTAIRSVT